MTGAPPRVSVIVPCYGQAHFLPEAIASVMAQTLTDWECIIVDDGSKDDTEEVARRLLAEDPLGRIRLLRQQNQGLSGARNAGIRASRGRYILPLDSDDRIEPTMLQKTVAILEEDPGVDIVYTQMRVFGVEEGVWDIQPFVLTRAVDACPIGYCSLYRRGVWAAVGGYNTNLDSYEDWNFWVGALRRGIRGKFVPEPLFCYRRADGSMMTRAVRFRDRLTARITLNHPDVFSAERETAARALLQPLGLAGEGAAAGPAGGVVRQPQHARPTVSVIMPTRDRPETLQVALQSVLDQTFQDFEIIIVNDGGCPVAECVTHLDVGRKVTLIDLPDARGPAAARNVALRLARGRLVAYLDDDDAYLPDHLCGLISALDESEARIGYSRARRVDQRQGGTALEASGASALSGAPFSPHVLLGANYIPLVTVMHERALLDEMGAFDETLPLHEDWEFLLRVSRRFPFVYLPRVTCRAAHWLDEGGLSARRRDLAPWCERAIRRKHGGQAEDPATALRDTQYQEQLRGVEHLLEEGSIDQAVSVLEAIVAAAPMHARALGDLAVVYNMAARKDEAAAMLERAVELDPQSAPLRLSLAVLHLSAGRPQRSAKILEEALARNPRDIDALILTGDVMLALQRPQQAEEFFRAAARLEPDNAAAAQRLALTPTSSRP